MRWLSVTYRLSGGCSQSAVCDFNSKPVNRVFELPYKIRQSSTSFKLVNTSQRFWLTLLSINNWFIPSKPLISWRLLLIASNVQVAFARRCLPALHHGRSGRFAVLAKFPGEGRDVFKAWPGPSFACYQQQLETAAIDLPPDYWHSGADRQFLTFHL